MPRFLAALLVLLAAPLSAQEVKLPAEINAVPGAWLIIAPEIVSGGKAKFRIDPALQEVRLDLLFPPEVASQARGKVLQGAIPGRYKVEAWNAKDSEASDIAVCWVVIAGTPPGPVIPDPPKPDPLVIVPPIPAGPRQVLILRESSEDTPTLARLFTSLQAGKLNAYLRSKGHSAFVLDDDDESQKVKDWNKALGIKLPALAILDDKGAILYKTTLPDNASDEDVMTVLKAWEGAK